MIAVIIGLLVLLVIAHEFGHYYEMRRQGIEVKEFGIGLPLGQIRFSFYSKFMKCRLTLTPFLLGAYVMPTSKGERRMEKLSYKNQSLIYGTGPWVNFILTIPTLLTMLLANGTLSTASWVILITAMFSACFRKLFCRYLSLVLGAAIFAFVMYQIIDGLIVQKTLASILGGPVTVVKFGLEQTGWLGFVRFMAIISFSLAALNSIPFGPVDGGKTAHALFRELGFSKIYRVANICGSTLLAVIFGVALFNDILILFPK